MSESALEYFSDLTEEEGEELVDYDFTVQGKVETEGIEDLNEFNEREEFPASFLLKRNPPKNFPMLESFGFEGTDEMTEEESLKYHIEQLGQLEDTYRPHFRRLYDYQLVAQRKYQKALRELLQKSSDPTVTTADTPAPEKTENTEAEPTKQYPLSNSSILKNIRRQTDYYRAERQERLMAEEENNGVYMRRFPMVVSDDAPTNTCRVENCQMRSIRPTAFCYSHILNDPDQRLFVGCTYKLQSGLPCNYPLLMAHSPSFCDAHVEIDNLPITHQEPGPQLQSEGVDEMEMEKFPLDDFGEPPTSISILSSLHQVECNK